MNRQAHRFHVKLKEDAWDAPVMFQHARIVRDAVLVSLQWARAWCNVGCWDDVEEVLIRDEGYITVSDRMNGAARVHSRSWVSSNELSRG